MIIGVILGILAASSQSFSYLCSRVYLDMRGDPLSLFVLSHLLIGVFSILGLPFLWPSDIPELRVYFWPLTHCTLFYLAGQYCLFSALKNAEASMISPLLGLKVLFLAILSALILGTRFTALQWLSIMLCICAAFTLNKVGGGVSWKSILWTIGACLGYSFSDLNIKELVDCFPELDIFHRSLFTASMSYALCGLICAFICIVRRISLKNIGKAAPFSIFWFGAIIFLFSCFAIIGPVFGNIVQSCRGIISIFLGAVAAYAGLVNIESKTSRSVLLQRIAAAVLMTVAIALFYLGDS
jgi:drug/metabolite transporter (DMT)-like permease